MNRVGVEALMNTLGERIRSLRKQKKLTLEVCAGKQMTKGMLSLIENNKANPSMENLNYLAKRLEVDLSELWADISGEELKKLLDEAETFIKTEDVENHLEVVERIEPILPKLTKGYEAGRLLEIYSKLSFNLKRNNWEVYAEKASVIYDELNILPRQAAVGIFRALVLFIEHHYEEALDRLMQERQKVEGKSGYIDPLTKLDLDTYEVLMRFAVNDSEEATRVMNEAIAYSKKELIFYQTGQLYRIAAYQALHDENEEKLSYYERKILEYKKFAEDEQSVFFTEIMRIHQLNSFKHKYNEALKQLDAMQKLLEDEPIFINYAKLERGKALYGLGRFEEALKQLKQVTISELLHHPFDLSIYYEKDAYAALCHLKLGDLVNALKFAEVAEANMSLMPDSLYKQFVLQTAEEIRGQTKHS